MIDVDSGFESEVINNSLLKLLPIALSTLSDLGREVILLKYFIYPTAVGINCGALKMISSVPFPLLAAL